MKELDRFAKCKLPNDFGKSNRLIMGGYNSGRRSGKQCTDVVRSLDVRQIQKSGLLFAGAAFDWSWTRHGTTQATISISVRERNVLLSYQQSWRGNAWQRCSNTIQLTWTACNYGGHRAWWLCPSCGRRVALLYSGQGSYACRHCFNLAHRSQRETEEDLAARRANKLRRRLGWNVGILNSPSGKPKGMHWRTFERLRASHDQHALMALTGMSMQLTTLTDRLRQMK